MRAKFTPILAFAVLALLAVSETAHAFSCPPKGPVATGSRVTVVYDPADTTMKACVGSSWVTLAGGGGATNLDGLSDVVIASPANNQVLLFNGTNWVNSALSITETDPKVGALTGNQWCAANAGGTAIVCNQAPPSGGGGTSSGTAGYLQISGGSGAFTTSGTTAGEQLFWNNTTKMLGIGTATPVNELDIVDTSTSGNAPFLALRNTSGATANTYGPGIILDNDIASTDGYVINQRADSTARFNIARSSSPFTEFFTILQNGNVGIGTAVPTQKLQIGDGTGSGTLRISAAFPEINLDQGTQFTGFQVRRANDLGGINAWQVKAVENLPLLFGTDNAARMVIDGTGNVGIGTTTPGAPLHVRSSSAFPQLRLSTSQWPGNHWDIGHNAATSTNDFGLTFQRSGTSFLVLGDQGNGGSYFPTGNVGIGTAAPQDLVHIGGVGRLFLGSEGATRVGLLFDAHPNLNYARIHAYDYNTGLGRNLAINPFGGGNVGIGTTTPIYRLDISGSSIRIANPNSGNTAWSEIDLFSGRTTPDEKVWNIANDPGNGSFKIRALNDSRTAETITPPFNILRNGNVGIGTTSTNFRLDVNGTANINGLYICATTNCGIITRHIDGKVPGSTALDHLYINHSSGFNAYVGGLLVQTSDRRMKKGIASIDNSLAKLDGIHGVTYQWIDPKRPQERQIGLIAQDVEKAFPEAVRADENGFLHLDYGALVAPLVEAVKELKADNDDLRSDIKMLRDELEHLKANR